MQELQLWSLQVNLPCFFMEKVLETPEPGTAMLWRALPAWLARLYPKNQMALEQNLIFCFKFYIFFQQAANKLPSGFKV